MDELNSIEIDEVSGGNPVVAAGAIIVVGTVVLVAIGFVDGWLEERNKSGQKAREKSSQKTKGTE